MYQGPIWIKLQNNLVLIFPPAGVKSNHKVIIVHIWRGNIFSWQTNLIGKDLLFSPLQIELQIADSFEDCSTPVYDLVSYKAKSFKG